MGLTMLQCEKCGARAAESNGRWASVLVDDPGALPKVACPKCADQLQQGWDTEIDPATQKPRRFQREFRSSIQRF